MAHSELYGPFSQSLHFWTYDYHGHYFHAGDLGVKNCVRENNNREVNVRV